MDAAQWMQGIVVGFAGALFGFGALMVLLRRRATLAQTINEPTHEHDLRIGFYVIGVFDVCGQSARLREPMEFRDERRVAIFAYTLLREIGNAPVSSRNRRTPRGVKRKMSNYPLRPRHAPTRTMNAKIAIEIVK